MAIAKLDQLIELAVHIRTAWLVSPGSEHARKAPGRRLGPLEGDMSESEVRGAAQYLLKSMSEVQRAEYAFCFQAGRSKEFLFALLREPSVLKAEALEELWKDWANIKNIAEYKEALEQSKKCTERQTKQEAELQNLRMQINRLRQKGQDTEDLLLQLRDKEKSYERRKKRARSPTPPPRSAHNPPK